MQVRARLTLLSTFAGLLLVVGAIPASAARIALGHGPEAFEEAFSGPALAGQAVVMVSLAQRPRVLLETPGRPTRLLATLPALPFAGPSHSAVVSASSTRWAAQFSSEDSGSK